MVLIQNQGSDQLEADGHLCNQVSDSRRRQTAKTQGGAQHHGKVIKEGDCVPYLLSASAQGTGMGLKSCYEVLGCTGVEILTRVSGCLAGSQARLPSPVVHWVARAIV